MTDWPWLIIIFPDYCNRSSYKFRLFFLLILVDILPPTNQPSNQLLFYPLSLWPLYRGGGCWRKQLLYGAVICKYRFLKSEATFLINLFYKSLIQNMWILHRTCRHNTVSLFVQNITNLNSLFNKLFIHRIYTQIENVIQF